MVLVPLQPPYTGESFSLASAIVEDGARLDVAVNGFWGSCHQKMLRCLILMLHLTEIPICLHYIVD